MWILLSKVLPYLLYPLSVVLLSGGLGVLLRRLGARRSGGVMLTFALTVLAVSSNPWLADRFRARLEHWYTPVTAQQAPAADAIVLLGGALYLPVSPRVTAELSDATDRVLYAARLYRAGRAPRIIVTGGNAFEQVDGVRAESWYVAELLAEWGVPPGAITIEENSRNTRQNALETKKILDRDRIKTILLVTSAMHMPRALATFEGVGIDAIAVPVDYTVDAYRMPAILDMLPSAAAMAFNAQTLREYLGIAMYGFRGWLDGRASSSSR